MTNVERIDNSVITFQPQSTAPLSAEIVSGRIQSLLDNITEINTRSDDTYLFPMSAMTAGLALDYGTDDEAHVYGAIVPESTHQADKGMLHTLVSEDAFHPNWYLPSFADNITENVMPGFTIFNDKDALASYDLLTKDGMMVRAKDPSANGGGRQILLTSKEHLEDILSKYKDISKIGLVLEANTDRITNMPTVGQINLLGNKYSWISHNFNVIDNTALRFGGTHLSIAKGSHSDLLQEFEFNDGDVRAIKVAEAVLKEYRASNIKVGRCALDVLQGITSNGRQINGVVDPSLRPSASSVAEIRGIEEIHESKSLSSSVKLSFLYDKLLPIPDNAEVFLDHEKLRIAVEVIPK